MSHQHVLPIQVLDNIKDTFILESPIHGFGLWSNKFIAKDVLLCELDGQKIPYADYKNFIKNLEKQQMIEWNALSEDLLLVRFFRTKYSFINHSKDPNCIVKDNNLGAPQVFTIKNILKGEELTLNYCNEPLPEDYLTGHGSIYL